MQIHPNLLADGGLENVLSFEKLSIVGVLMLVLWAIITKRLVPGWLYEDQKQEAARLRKELDDERALKREVVSAAVPLLQKMDEYEEEAATPSPPVAAAEEGRTYSP